MGEVTRKRSYRTRATVSVNRGSLKEWGCRVHPSFPVLPRSTGGKVEKTEVYLVQGQGP